MNRIVRLFAYWAVFLVETIVVLTLLQFATLWRSVSPSIAGPALQSMVLLLVVIGTQLLTQPRGEDRDWYLGFAAAAMAIGLMLAVTHYSIAPISVRRCVLMGLPVLCTAAVASIAASSVSSRTGATARAVLAILLLLLASFIPAVLIQVFSVGE